MDDKELRAMLGKPKEDTYVYISMEEAMSMDMVKEIKRLKVQVRGAWNVIDDLRDKAAKESCYVAVYSNEKDKEIKILEYIIYIILFLFIAVILSFVWQNYKRIL